jgi:hypothetical protein
MEQDRLDILRKVENGEISLEKASEILAGSDQNEGGIVSNFDDNDVFHQNRFTTKQPETASWLKSNHHP